MLAHLRNSSLRPLRPCSAATSSRLLSVSAVRQRENEDASESRDEDERPRRRGEGSESAAYSPDEKGYVAWLEGEGAQYKTAHRPRNWLGGKTPFPLNPSFKPPTPVGEATKQLIYDQFMSNPAENHVRALAALHGLSIARVDAILRLKGLEEHWKKGKQLQTGFQAGMEQILGVQDNKKTGNTLASLSEDAIEADLQSDAEANDKARDRYQRLFWEPVPEGKEPVIPEALAKTQVHKERKTMPVTVVERDTRPDVHFVDVGDSFIDPKVEKDRAKRAAHRADLRRKQHKSGATSAPKTAA